jgi:8-oxo-dGTP diphosphatase
LDDQGRLLLREPKEHYAGYVWTFPKGKSDVGETAVQTALRELKEEKVLTGRILARLPGTFRGQTGATVFYLAAMVESGGPLDSETSSIRWATEAEAKLLIAETTDLPGRKRDLDVLAAALNAWSRR